MVVEVPPPKTHPSGGVFVKYSADGGSFAYYTSGRMAAAYERMGGGFYCYFYADNRAGTTLMAMDPSGCGYCAFANGKPRLTSQMHGGTFCDESGTIIRSWTRSKPLRANDPISFDLSPTIRISFGSRQLITAKLTCAGLVEEYQLAQENRERRSATAMKEIDVTPTHITEDSMQKHPQLRSIVASCASLQASIGRGDWAVDSYVSKDKMTATLSDIRASDQRPKRPL